MRIRRRGDLYTTAYDDGDGWITLGERPARSGPVTVHIAACNWYTDTPFRWAIEDFELTVFRAVEPTLLTNLDLSDSVGGVDPRLQLFADAGVVAALDGQLHLQKLAGHIGRVGVQLDRSRWELRDDFDVVLGFEVPVFPRTRAGVAELSLQLCSAKANFGTIMFRATRTGLFYRAFYRVDEGVQQTHDRSGRIRIRRAGSDLHFDYWDGEWRNLLVRDGVSPEIGFQFMVQLATTAEDREYVAIIDELSVTTLSER